MTMGRDRSPPGRPAQAREKIAGFPAGTLGPTFPHSSTMDIEQINAIGSTLADLTARTAALRGYL